MHHGASSRVHSRSSVRSSPRLWPPDGSVALGLFPGLHTPPLPATHAGVGTGTWTLAWDYAADISRPPFRATARCVRPRVALWSCIRPGRVAPDHRVRPWPSLIMVVLMVFCLRLPETNTRRPG